MNDPLSFIIFILTCFGMVALFKLILLRAIGSYKKGNYLVKNVGSFFIIAVENNGKTIPATQFVKPYKKEIDVDVYKLIEDDYSTFQTAEIALTKFKLAIGQVKL